MKTYLNLLLVFLLCMATACNEGANNNETKEPAEEVNEELGIQASEDDAEFLLDAYSFNIMMVRYGEEALQNASTPALQDFANKSVQYHQNLSNEIETLASERDVALPAVVGDDVEERARKLKDKEGKDFDEAYIDLLGGLQEKMISQYEDAAEEAEDAGIRNWASQTLPDIKAHELTVENLEERID